MRAGPALLLSLILSASPITAQNADREIRSRISDWFSSYPGISQDNAVKVIGTDISHRDRSITVTLNDSFSRLLFRNDIIDSIESGLRRELPSSVRKYSLSIISNSKDIRTLVPNRHREFADQTLLWNGTAYTGAPWVTNADAPYTPQNGLKGVHLAVTPSHGYYFDNREEQVWKWQRPPLWCTREDFLTQSFAYPYLIPMLENAGATITSMRERDWQANCTVTDNESGRRAYREQFSRKSRWAKAEGNGYSAASGRIVTDGSATVRIAATGNGKPSDYSSATWIPDIPEDGAYSVYVTYQSFPNSITDARYTVCHKGGETTFTVNQRIGGGTWLYLGTFLFDRGRNNNGMVILDNSSSQTGIICADAVRFGGGTGNEPRGESISGKARYLEGSRYYARYSGAPDSVFLKYSGTDDYREDIQTRPRMTNWLSGGSVYNPSESGAGVPIELSVALHTDAGIRLGDSIVGTLGICTTQKKGGKLGTGLSRDVSRDLADQILTDLQRDIQSQTGRPWTLRGIMDQDYCESREPQMPSALIELLSHQNFYDLKYAFDPQFRFLVSRSIYKSILRYISFMHGRPYTVQPLPVSHFMIKEEDNSSLTLSWEPVFDPQEPSARPEGYIVYTSVDGLAFDNGIAIRYPYYRLVPEPDHIYSFKVCAANAGGQSMPSETLSACISRKSKGTILIVNGFQRLSGPATIETGTQLGFDLTADAGVQYMASPILCGYQKVFDRSHALMEETDELGYSGDEFNGTLLAGNTFNYPYIHGTAIMAAKEYSFVSCSRDALQDSLILLTDYPVADIILGLQKQTPNDTIMGCDFTAFPPSLRAQVTDFSARGGKLLVSGSYIGSDLCRTPEGSRFANDILKIRWAGPLTDPDEATVTGKNGTYTLSRGISPDIYSLQQPDILEPVGGATCVFTYRNSRYSSATAYRNGKQSTVVLGFPFESIKGDKTRAGAMAAILKILTD